MYMNNASLWYQTLEKPAWAPPSWLFGPVWTMFYIFIAVSFGYVVYLFLKKKIPFQVLAPFLLNLVSNVIFSPIQFGLQNNHLALADILLVDVTLLVALYRIFPYARWVTYINVPYLLWGFFATALQISITILN